MVSNIQYVNMLSSIDFYDIYVERFLITICRPHIIQLDIWWTWWRHQMEAFFALLAINAGNSRKGQWRVALIFFICAWINGWVNKHEAGELRLHRAHCDVIVMKIQYIRLNCRIACRSIMVGVDTTWPSKRKLGLISRYQNHIAVIKKELLDYRYLWLSLL